MNNLFSHHHLALTLRGSALILIASVLSACGGNGGTPSSSKSSSAVATSSSASSVTSVISSSSVVSSSRSSSSVVISSSSRSSLSSSSVSIPTGSPVQTAAAEGNKYDLKSAFTGQTRAPEVKTANVKNKTIAAVSSGSNYPWAIEFMPDGGDMLVTIKNGTIKKVTRAGEMSNVAVTMPSGLLNTGQAGLMDIALHPNFATNRWVYLTFFQSNGTGNGVSLARGKLSDDGQRLDNLTVLFKQTTTSKSTTNIGSRIAWDKDNNLYLSTGDQYDVPIRDQSATSNNHIGKILRLKDDGTPADGNPFASQGGTSKEVWSYGHRNMQALARHPATGELWTIEHGPRGGDELNLAKQGKNYGWPTITYGIGYDGAKVGNAITQQTGLEQPVYYWDPVIAPTGMAIYDGDMFPEWKGNVLVSSVGGFSSPNIQASLVRVMLNGERVIGEERVLANAIGKLRDVAVDPTDGSIWVINAAGSLIRIYR